MVTLGKRMAVKPVKETVVHGMDMMVLQTLLNHFLSVQHIEIQERGYISTKIYERLDAGETRFTCSKTVSMEEFLGKDLSAIIRSYDQDRCRSKPRSKQTNPINNHNLKVTSSNA